MRNFGIVLLIFGLIRLWIESKLKTATAANPVNPTEVKLDFVAFKSNVATTYTFIFVGLLLIFYKQLKSAV